MTADPLNPTDAVLRATQVDAEDDADIAARHARIVTERATHRNARIARHAAVLLCIDRLHRGSGFRPCPECRRDIADELEECRDR